jgi:transcriptional antiterminator RfaH
VTASLELGRWYLVYSKRRREEVVQFYLERKGLVVFFPRLLLQPFTQRPRIVPLFPNYLFVRIHKPADYDIVRWSSGVVRVVDFYGHPAPLDEEVVEFLRQQVTPAGIIAMNSALTVRNKVENENGRFVSIMNDLLNPHNSRDRVGVLMQLLSCQHMLG